jgi:hypothetical protein
MIKTKKQNDNVLDDVSYSFPQINKVKLIAGFSAIFIFAFIVNFPLGEIVKNKIKLALTRVPGCAIEVKDINFSLFLPSINLSNVNIPSRCAGKALMLSQMNVEFRGPSFSPLGLSTKIETKYMGLPIEVFASLGISKQLFKIDHMKVSLAQLSQKIPQVSLAGDVEVNAIVEITKNKLSKLNALVESKNLSIPVQNIEGFTVPNMILKNFSVQIAQTNPKRMILKKFIIGDLKSPVRANYTGTITPNKQNFLLSKIDLKGEVAFGKVIEDQFGLLLGFFNAFPKKDKFYQMRLQGTIRHPKPKPL